MHRVTPTSVRHELAVMSAGAEDLGERRNLTLVIYHAMQSDVRPTDPDGWLDGFRASMKVYAALAQRASYLAHV